MSLQYIIDGYNIINHPQFTKHTTHKLKDLRAALLEFIKRNKLCGSPKNKVTVVFDGHADSPYHKISEASINIIFSRKLTADQTINRIVEKTDNPKNIVVVSDDKQIKLFIKSLGARALSVEDFIRSKEKIRKSEQDLLKPELSYSQICKINQELEKIWLK